jgi:hypothetical protein
MADGLEARVARLEEAVVSIRDIVREDKVDRREDSKEVLKRLEQVQQSVQSTGQIVAQLSFEKCGERLDEHDDQIGDLSGRIADIEKQNVPGALLHLNDRVGKLEEQFKFARWLLGGGFHAVWKIGGLLASVGALGGVVSYFAQHIHFS